MDTGRVADVPKGINLSGTVAFVRPFLPYLAIIAAFSWGMVMVTWVLLPQARTVELVIPPGTAEQIARGEVVDALPSTLLLRRGDTLLLINHDDTPHRIGSVWVDPGMRTRTLVTKEFQNAGTVACSFHPGGSIGVAPESRPGLEATALPSLMIFIPLSIILMTTITITRRLHSG